MSELVYSMALMAPIRSLAFASVFALVGCKGCKNEHPYVPYSIGGDGGAEGVGDKPTLTVAGDDGGAFQEQPAEKAPANTTEWALGGVSVRAPAGSVFELGLARDLDGDGATDVVAITRLAANAGDPGTLVFYKSTPQGMTQSSPIATGSLPKMGQCTATRRLAQVGKRSVLVELGQKCTPQPTRDPSRWVAVLAFTPLARTHFSASVVDPPNAPALFFNVDASDRDGDTIDDVSVRVSIEGGGGPLEPLSRTTATLGWFDRPAGMSRDGDDPDGSLRLLSATAQALAAKPKEAAGVPPRVRAIRGLFSALCNEGGAPRLLKVLGDAPLSCGSSRALEEAGLAEVRAYATMGDALMATTALSRAQLAPATKSPNRGKDAESWILGASPAVSATSVRQVAAVPLIERGRQPAWGALAFEASGKLLVRTANGVVRMDPETGDELDARDVSPWSMAVISPDGGSRFIEAYNACDGLVLHATLAPTANGDMTDVELPIVPALGSHCATSKGEPVTATPIAWGAAGLEAIVDGSLILVSPQGRASVLQSLMNQAVSPGAPRSPDGKTLVTPTSLGIVVRAAKSRTLRASELDGAYAELRDCAVSDDGTRVACVRAGHAFVGQW